MVIPFYVCEGMQHPIVSVTRLLAQGFSLTLTGTEPTLTHGQGFKVPLTKKNQLLYMHLELAPLEQAAMIVRTHGLTPTGPCVQQGGNNNYWKYNEAGYLVRLHKRDRKVMFTPDHGKQSTCPAPLDRFDNYRRTVIHREQQEPLALEDQYKTLSKEHRNREPTGGLWQGETWFRILPEQKEGTTRIQQEQSQNKQSTSIPVLMRHTGKQSEKETAIPPPEKVQRTTD